MRDAANVHIGQGRTNILFGIQMRAYEEDEAIQCESLRSSRVAIRRFRLSVPKSLLAITAQGQTLMSFHEDCPGVSSA